MKRSKALWVVICFNVILLLLPLRLWTQGCSDAGACTLYGLEGVETSPMTEDQMQFTAGVSYGIGEAAIQIFTGYFELGIAVTDELTMVTKMVVHRAEDSIAATFALADVYMSVDYQLFPQWHLVGGVKIPLFNGNALHQGQPLPLAYQPTIGTVDGIIGLAGRIGRWNVMIAWQRALTPSRNQFLAETLSPLSPFREFSSSNQLRRADDLILRVMYSIPFSNQWQAKVGILPIYHLANDRYVDSAGMDQPIEGSQGLTFNLNGLVEYAVSSSQMLQLGVGFPLLIRQTRPDGLTRHFVATLQYTIRF